MRTFCEECAQRRAEAEAIKGGAKGEPVAEAPSEQPEARGRPLVETISDVWLIVKSLAALLVLIAAPPIIVWGVYCGYRDDQAIAATKAAHDRRKAPYTAYEMRTLRAP